MGRGHVKRAGTVLRRKSYTGIDGARNQAAFAADGGESAARGTASALSAQPDLWVTHRGSAGDCVDVVPHQSRLDLPHWLVALVSAARTANGAARRLSGEPAVGVRKGLPAGETLMEQTLAGL